LWIWIASESALATGARQQGDRAQDLIERDFAGLPMVRRIFEIVKENRRLDQGPECAPRRFHRSSSNDDRLSLMTLPPKNVSQG
jgi:hypothetical protein